MHGFGALRVSSAYSVGAKRVPQVHSAPPCSHILHFCGSCVHGGCREGIKNVTQQKRDLLCGEKVILQRAVTAVQTIREKSTKVFNRWSLQANAVSVKSAHM